MRPGVPLQVEGVVEAFSAKGAEVALGVAVTLHVSVQQPLQAEDFGTDATLKLAGITLRTHSRKSIIAEQVRCIIGQGVLDAVAAVDQLYRRIRTQAQLERHIHYYQLCWYKTDNLCTV